jgi:hypothetical protein
MHMFEHGARRQFTSPFGTLRSRLSPGSMTDDPEEGQTETRDVFRRANQELDASSSQMGLSGPRPYLCECNDARCTRTMLIDGDAYAGVRAEPERFVVLPGHDEGLQVINEGGAYVVVERRR